MNSLSSCFIKLFSFFSFMGSWGEIYNEQMETILCRVIETVIAVIVDGDFTLKDSFPN